MKAKLTRKPFLAGVISVIKKVDRETNPSGYSLIVTAKDHGYPVSQSSTALVNITISDVNDNAPRFDKFTYSAEVREDSKVNTVVTMVHAVDDDEGLAGEVVYSITGLSLHEPLYNEFLCIMKNILRPRKVITKYMGLYLDIMKPHHSEHILPACFKL